MYYAVTGHFILIPTLYCVLLTFDGLRIIRGIVMRSSAAIKRAFHFGQSGSSWCTRCTGSSCEEDVGFLYDDTGQVHGYVIDSEKINEAALRPYAGENRRLRDSPPSDGIYKRPGDLKKLISRRPDNINAVRFSRDLLTSLLSGVEGCDNFSSGTRRFGHLKLPAVKMFSSETDFEELPGSSWKDATERKEKAGEGEVKSDRPTDRGIEPPVTSGGPSEQSAETLFPPDERDAAEDPDGLHDRSDYTLRIKQGQEKKNDRVYWASLIVTGLVTGAVIFSLFHRQITNALFPDHTQEMAVGSGDSSGSVMKTVPEDEGPLAGKSPQDGLSGTVYGERHKDPSSDPPEKGAGELSSDGEEAEKSLLSAGSVKDPSAGDDGNVIVRKKNRVPPAKAASREQALYLLQVGAYGKRENAESVSSRLRLKGYDVALRQVSRSDGVRLHRVLVGPFETRNEALSLSRAILNKEGLKSMVVMEPATPGKEVYSLQVGIYEAKKYADTIAQKMKLKGYDVFILRSSGNDGMYVYRVLVGEYDNRKDALEQSKSILQKEGIESFIYSH
jgi:cell division protein FtsN